MGCCEGVECKFLMSLRWMRSRASRQWLPRQAVFTPSQPQKLVSVALGLPGWPQKPFIKQNCFVTSVCWLLFAFHWPFWDFFSETFLSVETKTFVRAIVFSSASTGKVLHRVGLLAEPGGRILARFWMSWNSKVAFEFLLQRIHNEANWGSLDRIFRILTPECP